MYQHQLKVRERKWMQTRSTYQTEKDFLCKEYDLANIAAQRAYTRTQIQLNNARSMAILQNQEDFKKMLQNEGDIEVSAAERGIRGKSVARQLLQNKANFGIGQAMRSRALATAGFNAKEAMQDTRRQLKTQLNRSFGKVAVAPVQDFAPPPPQMENVGLTLMMGMGQALGAGLEGMPKNTMGPNLPTQNVTTPTYAAPPPMASGAYNTGIPYQLPAGSFGITPGYQGY